MNGTVQPPPLILQTAQRAFRRLWAAVSGGGRGTRFGLQNLFLHAKAGRASRRRGSPPLLDTLVTHSNREKLLDPFKINDLANFTDKRKAFILVVSRQGNNSMKRFCPCQLELGELCYG
jgi:hypothetical protein